MKKPELGAGYKRKYDNNANALKEGRHNVTGGDREHGES